MAVVSAILQPIIPGDQHGDALLAILKADWATSFILSTAFANASGVAAIQSTLTELGANCRIFVGVRNGSTTAQGISSLLKTGAVVYTVDTATRSRIFHPKVYLARNADRAIAIVTSSNLTHAGLYNNIEVGACIALDLAIPDDCEFVRKIEDSLTNLPIQFPEHCVEVTSGRTVVNLMRQGLLEDERNPKTQSTAGVGSQGSEQTKPRINLPSKAPPKTKIRRKKVLLAPARRRISSIPHFGQLIWSKSSLPRTDLQLLEVGHDPGVLRLTQARFEIDGARIDQTTYFRNSVFGSLAWNIDPADPAKEMAHASFALVIADVYLRDFTLKLSHKPAWEAGQRNYTTGLHWGDSTELIRKEALIGRTLRLYEPALPGNSFIIEID